MKKFILIFLGVLILSACRSRDNLEITPLEAILTTSDVNLTETPAFNASDSEADSEQNFQDPQTATLLSLVQVDDYPFYTMSYQADYALTALDQSPLPVISQFEPAESWACSLFAALADPDSGLYGRNFDWEFSPALLLFTDPPGGYASVSMVDIAYLGFAGGQSANLTEKPVNELTGLLNAPFIPFDGLNEAGLAIGMAAVSPGYVPTDPGKATLGSLEIIRVILDGAATVEEAVEILQRYNIDFEGGPPIHYLVADAQGQAALVEHQGGEIHVIYNEKPWHLATNFLNSAFESQDGHCWRYDTIDTQLRSAQGVLSPESAMNLLKDVSQGNTQWSVVYGISTGAIQVALAGEYQPVYNFQLDMHIK